MTRTHTGIIKMTDDEQQQTNLDHCLNVIRQLIDEYPGGEALMALGYIGAEQQVKGHWGQG
ncbi:hypothetical protein PSI23_17735 [Xenorhabdus sp. XENO-10]|uniref:Uncharacterized protein n=1 Tax=Xenorhabdus yunnanensis TaxID=3025878 RepID=A0ABT5LIZ9_9GAMM|nr:hypothetical protein [Xenorhabdus yunnanensis]MDC9591077.1 hypothetical protein [Xenorhabdus yunnanensis]